MKQAIHIFKKDVGRFRYHIAMSLLASIAFCLVEVNNVRKPGSISFFLPVTWWFLIAAVIHAEPLSGTGHFWLARPYDWRSLLFAKVLFTVAFVNLPLLIADAVIVHAAGFSIMTNLTGLFWTQVLLVIAFELPAAALASLTSNLLELLVVTLLLIFIALSRILFFHFSHFGFDWAEMEWVRSYYLLVQIAVVATLVLLSQYAFRNTVLMRSVAALMPVVLLASSTLLPWTAAFAVQTRFSKQSVDMSSIQIELDSERKWSGRVYLGDQQDVIADIPVQISGLPNGAEWKPDGVTMTLQASGFQPWVVDQPPPNAFGIDSGSVSLRATMNRAFYEGVKHEMLQVRGTMYLSVYGPKKSTFIPLTGDRIGAGGGTLCEASPRLVLCNSAFRRQAGWIDMRLRQASAGGFRQVRESLSGAASYSPFPAEFAIDPMFRLSSVRLWPVTEVRLEAREPIAHLKKDFELDRLILQDFHFQN